MLALSWRRWFRFTDDETQQEALETWPKYRVWAVTYGSSCNTNHATKWTWRAWSFFCRCIDSEDVRNAKGERFSFSAGFTSGAWTVRGEKWTRKCSGLLRPESETATKIDVAFCSHRPQRAVYNAYLENRRDVVGKNRKKKRKRKESCISKGLWVFAIRAASDSEIGDCALHQVNVFRSLGTYFLRVRRWSVCRQWYFTPDWLHAWVCTKPSLVGQFLRKGSIS